jgi:hypothetical protein
LQALGEYLRYRCPLDRRIAEMATLIAARHMSQQYDQQAHDRIAEGRPRRGDRGDHRGTRLR